MQIRVEKNMGHYILESLLDKVQIILQDWNMIDNAGVMPDLTKTQFQHIS